MEFRGKLRTLFENISQVVSAGWLLKKTCNCSSFQDPSLVLNASQSLISQCLSDFDHQSFPDIEVSLLLFHYISEHNFEKVSLLYHHNNNNYYYYCFFCAEYTWLFFTCIFYLLLAVWVFFSRWFSLPHYNDTGKSHDCHVIITCFLMHRYWTAICLTILILLYCYK